MSVGYAGLKLEALKVYAEKHNAIIVDIRMSPYSKNAEFNQTVMRRVLGPRYKHLLAFGNKNYKDRGLPFDLVEPQIGLQVIKRMIEYNHLILLCVCYKLEGCHRKFVCEIIDQELGIPTRHLTAKEITEDVRVTAIQTSFDELGDSQPL